MNKAILISGILALVLSSTANASSKELDDTLAQAETELAAADKAKFTWRDTKKFLEEAKKLQGEGKLDEALKLAKKALSEAKLAQKQAQDQAGAKPVY